MSCPQYPTSADPPGETETGEPSITSPLTVPLPWLAETLVAVTKPPNSETEPSVTRASLHFAPLAVAYANATTGEVVGYADGPRLEAGVPRTRARPPGGAIAASPAPMHVVGR